MILQLREGLREHLLVLYHTIRWSFVELRKNLRFFLSELVSGFCRRSEGPKGQAGICFMVRAGHADTVLTFGETSLTRSSCSRAPRRLPTGKRT
mmetsp:Transcript_14895/g.60749  ORF Transcript_14895/g.60749 Transcript_14895/m.60749 type:complete len:94 (+) Transcript_14895:6744-7025(+)